ncbi:LPD29 domain-containing protein [Brevibacillus brevis]|uniref:LPD29 domain-containing protein n=1 Tax=Brevibacillus brevis TaxID=1393 RepID=UPI0007D8BB52|nr:LPD29 domain-containing protein [Brevibacillus brevis]
MTTAVLKINEELNGIELYFNTKPVQNVINKLKENGFRWSGFKKCWYTKKSEEAFQIANSLTNDHEESTVTTEIKSIEAKNIELNLWESTKWSEIQVNKEQSTKEMAKEIRTHVRKRFPQCKFSITSDYNSIRFYIVSSPYEKESTYILAIREYCSKLLNAYKYCTNYDPYGDYGSSYNFYGSVSIHWEYNQIETTEAHKKDMSEFDGKFAGFEKAEEERKEKEFQEYQQQRELEAIEIKKRQQGQKQTEFIYNNIDVRTLEENEQYFVIGSEFAELNKNNTIDEYIYEVSHGKYSLENVKITKEVHFTNEEALTHFSNMLLHDFDFLCETGGSYTEDNRINSMTDFYNMDKEERQTVKWNLLGVAVYFNNKLQFVVDAQGYSYARYVGLTTNATIEKTFTYEQVLNKEEITALKEQAAQLEDVSTNILSELDIKETWQNENWKEYKEAIKAKFKQSNMKLTKKIIQQLDIESLKVSMYKLLQEVNGIQEQFKDADIQQGEKLTLFYISDFGSMVTNRVTFDSVTPTTYAQYDNAVKLTYKPENKRQLYYTYHYSDMLVYKGWYNLPETILNYVETHNGYVLTKSKHMSCDKKQYDAVLEHFEQQGVTPIVNTYKTTF